MKFTEPITHLSLDERADCVMYHVTVPVSIAEEIGADDLTTMHQFLEAIESRGEYAAFEVARIDGDEAKAWADGLAAAEELLQSRNQDQRAAAGTGDGRP